MTALTGDNNYGWGFSFTTSLGDVSFAEQAVLFEDATSRAIQLAEDGTRANNPPVSSVDRHAFTASASASVGASSLDLETERRFYLRSAVASQTKIQFNWLDTNADRHGGDCTPDATIITAPYVDELLLSAHRAVAILGFEDTSKVVHAYLLVRALVAKDDAPTWAIVEQVDSLAQRVNLSVRLTYPHLGNVGVRLLRKEWKVTAKPNPWTYWVNGIMVQISTSQNPDNVIKPT